jgi:ribulose-5-phosphate 4-epimerase/fuculose-1-phosphate aldolase
MEFAFHGTVPPELEGFRAGLEEALQSRGYAKLDSPDHATLVCNFVDADNPRPYRRVNKWTFVASFWYAAVPPEDFIRRGYPVLVRALSNLSVCVVPGQVARFLTLEQGNYAVDYAENPATFYDRVVARLAPLAESNLVIENIFEPTLAPELWAGDEITATLTWAGEQLAKLELLPAPFPIEEILDKRDLEHVKRLYSIGGLSYGNLSARRDATTFWMSASGVDKANLHEVGRDFLLVTGYAPEQRAMVLSVPPGIEPRRVSVDAIEHWKIYTEHPEVGAILHIHAWVDGVEATEINFPCGTAELADAVADLVRRSPDPSRTIVGLKNHGLTITGTSLEEIFERVGPHIQRQVPMS